MGLARIYVEKNTTRMYQKAFEMLFNCLAKVIRQPILWNHIHNNGFKAITINMCNKQARGKFILCLY